LIKTETLEFPELISDEGRLKFDDTDYAVDSNNREEKIVAPKTIDRLEEISQMRNAQRKIDEQDNSEQDDFENVKIKIFDDGAKLGALDVHVIDQPNLSLSGDLLLDDIEVLA
jgi:hypothetical protein